MQQWLDASGRSSQEDTHAANAHAAPGWHNCIHFWDVIAQFRRDRHLASSAPGLANARVDAELRAKVTPTKVIAPQPWTVERAGSAAASGKAATSAVHEKMKSWFESPDGLEWMRSRARMHASMDGEEEDDAAGAAAGSVKTKKMEANTTKRKHKP